jgi:PAS domain-containing protein
MGADTTELAGEDSSGSSPHIGIESSAEVAILKGMVDASADACWCMEFDQPVDLESPDREVIRQIFENGPRWRFCNQAMARLYRLPPHLDLSDRPVNEIFPRNRQNEEFVENLLRSGFQVDAAPALDSRYDGVQMHVENDVRAHIENGRLIRMFGVVRDVSKRRWRENDLKGKLQAVEWMMGAVPDALIAVDDFLLITAANPAAAKLFHTDVETLVGANARLYLRAPATTGEDQGAVLQRAVTQPRIAGEPVDLTLGIRTGATTHWRLNGGTGPDGKRMHVAIIRPLARAGEGAGERADVEAGAVRR